MVLLRDPEPRWAEESTQALKESLGWVSPEHKQKQTVALLMEAEVLEVGGILSGCTPPLRPSLQSTETLLLETSPHLDNDAEV